MKRFLLAALLLMAVANLSATTKYRYDTVPGDPLKTLSYTLPNGLKVMMSQNPRTPRIQTYIGVRVGGKNDPAETTGLAHYFEHLMFKGTQNFGTTNYAAEKPMLDEIEGLFEVYRTTTDSLTRAALYHRIDSISYEASKLAIPNEYDKMMSAIGANGTNAFTSNDVTCYVEDIPANELQRWAAVQADRFRNPVLRGFHTELETIYEEKNMSLTNDSRKANERMLALLFPSHPYGTQTVLGSQTHLKNPSITNIKNYHHQWYVPNNMLIAMAGDFDPDQALDIIIENFGDMQPNPDLHPLKVTPEKPLTAPVHDEVWGREAERVMLAWRLPEAKHPDMFLMQLVDMLLCNGNAGLMDLALNQAQKVLTSGSYVYDLADEGAFFVTGLPRQGQSLEEVEQLLLEQVRRVGAGDFSDELLDALKAIMMLNFEQQMLSNRARTQAYLDAFVNGADWADEVAKIENLKNVTREDVIAAARRYLGDNNYVAVYKRQGEPRDELKIAKPALTPIVTNRDTASVFLTDLLARNPEPIEPQFVDFQKDLTRRSLANGSELLYVHNPYNNLFSLTFVYETGTNADPLLEYAGEYLNYLGTPDMTPAQLREAFFLLACSYSISAGTRRSFITLSGLAENMPKAVELFEKVIATAIADTTTYSTYIDTVEKARADRKSNQRANVSAMNGYTIYGPKAVERIIATDSLRAITPEGYMASLRRLLESKHRVIYYGPLAPEKAVAEIDAAHLPGVDLKEAIAAEPLQPVVPQESIVYISPFEAKQLNLLMYTSDGQTFDPALHPQLALYNEYFGGSMNAIVFQEMREARSLAYSAWASMQEPSRLDTPYTFYASIGTQNDKLMDAIDAFHQIIDDMPQSPAAFELAKDGIAKRLRTARTIDDGIAWAYIAAQDRGLAPSLAPDSLNLQGSGTLAPDSLNLQGSNALSSGHRPRPVLPAGSSVGSTGLDLSRQLYEALPALTLEDIVAFQQQNVKGRKYIYGIVGKIEDLDLDALSRLGKVVILTPEQIFGY